MVECANTTQVNRTNNVEYAGGGALTVTGATITDCKNGPCLLSKVQPSRSSREAGGVFGSTAKAKLDLKKVAVNFILGDSCEVVTNENSHKAGLGPQASANKLSDFAVNLYMLSGVAGYTNSEGVFTHDDTYKRACTLLKEAIEAFVTKGEKGFSSTYGAEKQSAYEKGVKLEIAINDIVKRRPEVFKAAAAIVHKSYLSEGLVKAEEKRTGIPLSPEAARKSGEHGNASHDASAKVAELLKHHIEGADSKGLTHFTQELLNQLDLFCEAMPEAKSDNKTPGVVTTPDVQANGGERNGSNVQSVTTGAVHVNVTCGGITESNAETARINAETARINAETARINAETVRGFLDLSISNTLKNASNVIPEAFLNQTYVQSLDGDKGSIPPIFSKKPVSDKVDGVPSIKASDLVLNDADANADSVLMREKITTSYSSRDDLTKLGTWRTTIQGDANRLPKPFNGTELFDPNNSNQKRFLEDVASAFTSVGLTTKLLKNAIKKGDNPFQAEKGTPLHDACEKAMGDATEFMGAVKRLFEIYASLNKPLKQPVKEPGRIITSVGGFSSAGGHRISTV